MNDMASAIRLTSMRLLKVPNADVLFLCQYSTLPQGVKAFASRFRRCLEQEQRDCLPIALDLVEVCVQRRSSDGARKNGNCKSGEIFEL